MRNTASITANGLLFHCDFEEGSGSVAGDSSGNGNDGIIFGGAAWGAGEHGNGGGLVFDGVNDYVDIGDMDLTDDFTIAAWIKITGLGKFIIVGKTFQTYQIFVTSTGNLVVQRNASTPIVYNAGIVPGTWYHVALTFDTTSGMSLYLDGSLVSTDGNATTTNVNNIVTNIGATGITPKNIFSGVLDEVRIYSRSLTATEIQNLFSN